MKIATYIRDEMQGFGGLDLIEVHECFRKYTQMQRKIIRREKTLRREKKISSQSKRGKVNSDRQAHSPESPQATHTRRLATRTNSCAAALGTHGACIGLTWEVVHEQAAHFKNPISAKFKKNNL